MDSLNSIIDKICTKIGNADKRCSEITKLLTGSIKAGVKVDLPFEVDFLFALPHMIYEGFQRLSLYTFNKLVDEAIKEPDTLCQGWSITNVKLHRAGISLAMAYSHGDRYTQPMGVLVDIVPVYFHKNNEETCADWFDKAKRCIQDYGITDFRTFQLLMINDKDTGLIEGNIVSLLGEGEKRAFRVTKYLLQNSLHSIQIDQFSNLSVDEINRMYGPKPHIKSYYVRILLLHLVFATHNHTPADELTDGCLVFCLLDILAKAQSAILTRDHVLYFTHPIKSTNDIIITHENSFPYPFDSGDSYKGKTFDEITSSLCNDARNENFSNYHHKQMDQSDYFIDMENTENQEIEGRLKKSTYQSFFALISDDLLKRLGHLTLQRQILIAF